MDVREKLVEIIQNSVGGCARHWAEIIADGLISHGVTVQEWTSVNDPPKKDGKYLVHKLIFGRVSTMSVLGFAKDGEKVSKYDLHGEKNVWYEYDSEVGYFSVDSVTHWMPLPEPPKGE